MRIVLHFFAIAEHWSFAIFINTENADQTFRKIRGNLLQRVHISTTGGMLELKVLTIIMMKALERFDQKVIHWKPDGPAPV